MKLEAANVRSLPGLSRTLIYTMFMYCGIGDPCQKELKSKVKEGEMSLFSILKNVSPFLKTYP